jgi:hypothetical protein
MFADVSLPFHVWVKEGDRWVLLDTAGRFESAASSRRETPTSQVPSKELRRRPR